MRVTADGSAAAAGSPTGDALLAGQHQAAPGRA